MRSPGIDRVLHPGGGEPHAAPRDYFIVVVRPRAEPGTRVRQLAGGTLEGVDRALVARASASPRRAPTMRGGGGRSTRCPDGGGSCRRRIPPPPAGPSGGRVRSVGPDPGETGAERAAVAGSTGGPADLVVVGSGNLRLVVPAPPRPVPIEELAGALPRAGVGCWASRASRSSSPTAPAARWPSVGGGARAAGGVVEGVDRSPRSVVPAADLARAALMDVAPDLYVHSTLDPAPAGCTRSRTSSAARGLGGWQNGAVLVHPAD